MTDKPDLAAALTLASQEMLAEPRFHGSACDMAPYCSCGMTQNLMNVEREARAAPSAEGLNVERLARAMRAYDTKHPVEQDFDSDSYRREAARLAREYAALAPKPPEAGLPPADPGLMSGTPENKAWHKEHGK